MTDLGSLLTQNDTLGLLFDDWNIVDVSSQFHLKHDVVGEVIVIFFNYMVNKCELSVINNKCNLKSDKIH